MDPVSIASIMQRSVTTLSPEMTLEEARDCFLEKRIGGAPVVDSDGKLIGVFTHSDLFRVAFASDGSDFESNELLVGFSAFNNREDAETIQQRLRSQRVSDALSGELYSARSTDDAALVAREMRRHRVHRVVVTDSEGTVEGIVTPFDLLSIIAGPA